MDDARAGGHRSAVRARGHRTTSSTRPGSTAPILVQTISSTEETRDFLATAARVPFIAGVVGWVDLTDPDAAGAIDRLRTGPGGDRLIGIRHQVHDEPDPEWLLRPDVGRGLAAVEAAGSPTTCWSVRASCRRPWPSPVRDPGSAS